MFSPNSAPNRSFIRFYATAFFVVGLLITCFQWDADSFGFSDPRSFSEQHKAVSPATVEHDIAPWDGAAFNVWIPVEKNGGWPDAWINVRIWKAPEESKMKFVFPDETMKNGVATYYSNLVTPKAIDWWQQPHQSVKGWIRFRKLDGDQPVLGEFEFVTENGIPLKGRFEAHWLNRSWLVELSEQSKPVVSSEDRSGRTISDP